MQASLFLEDLVHSCESLFVCSNILPQRSEVTVDLLTRFLPCLGCCCASFQGSGSSTSESRMFHSCSVNIRLGEFALSVVFFSLFSACRRWSANNHIMDALEWYWPITVCNDWILFGPCPTLSVFEKRNWRTEPLPGILPELLCSLSHSRLKSGFLKQLEARDLHSRRLPCHFSFSKIMPN